jgi:hypothetical protein
LRAVSGEPLGIRGARGRRTQDRLIRSATSGFVRTAFKPGAPRRLGNC